MMRARNVCYFFFIFFREFFIARGTVYSELDTASLPFPSLLLSSSLSYFFFNFISSRIALKSHEYLITDGKVDAQKIADFESKFLIFLFLKFKLAAQI